MQGQDQSKVTIDATEKSTDEAETVQPAKPVFAPTPAPGAREFDWFAIGVVILIAALFALAARLSPQPATSLTPAAVLSATGCGLLVTALRKLHTSSRPGLFEAALGGLFLALFQFIAAITYPNVVYALGLAYDERLGFFTTWALIAVFSIIFSMVGASLGHLAFAPLRPLPAATKTHTRQPLPAKASPEARESTAAAKEDVRAGDVTEDAGKESANESNHSEIEEQDIQPAPVPELVHPVSAQRSLVSYLISVLLLGLAPTLVGYVFSAAFDYMLQANLFFPGPYPTLRLLSTMLPWQIPIPFSIGSSDPGSLTFLLWQLWRIPLFLGNPGMFDLQALEPYVFNGAALGLLLLTMRDQNTRGNPASDTSSRFVSLGWPTYLLLEIVLGILLVLPADLWIVRGLQGLLQGQIFAVQIRTLYILDQLTFMLNLVTGPLVCVGIGILLRLLRRKQANVQ
jgi:hypothetical protein